MFITDRKTCTYVLVGNDLPSDLFVNAILMSKLKLHVGVR